MFSFTLAAAAVMALFIYPQQKAHAAQPLFGSDRGEPRVRASLVQTLVNRFCGTGDFCQAYESTIR